MKKIFRLQLNFFYFILITFLIAACKQAEAITPTLVSPTKNIEEKEDEVEETEGDLVTATPESLIQIESIFEGSSPFCTPEVSESMFSTVCSGGSLSITQNENRRRIDIHLLREIPAKFLGSFSIEAKILSEPYEGLNLDQNQFGLIMVDGKGIRHVLRIRGSYFDWETWTIDNEVRVSSRNNLSYSPYILPAGDVNTFQLVCRKDNCDLFINQEFTARLPNDTPWGLYALGIFTASDWDEEFGTVQFFNFNANVLPGEQLESTPLHFSDSLTTDIGTFSSTGLSGAYSSFESDGFHFSPVRPYGYYAAKTNISMADVSVNAALDMEVNTEKSSSRYGGLICRSSQEGMYMAVVRANGTYTVFRDTPKKPLTMLAEQPSEYILTGSEVNKLRLDCVGDQINFYINGNLVESLTDSRYKLRFGRSGFFTKSGGEPDSGGIVFRDLVIEEIQ